MDRTVLHDLIMRSSPLGLSVTDCDGKIIEFNRAAERITGYSRDNVLRKPEEELFRMTFPANSLVSMPDVLQPHRKGETVEISLRKKDGGSIPVSVTSFPLCDERRNPVGGVKLFRDISTLKHRQRERQNLLAMFIHDMKNPLLAAKGFLTRLLRGKAGPLTGKQREYLDLISDNMSQIETFVMDFLDFSRFEGKRYRPTLRPCNILGALEKGIASLAVEAEAKDITVSFAPRCSVPAIPADEVMIGRLISNLLSNAIKYADPGGTIRISCMVLDGKVVIQVTNPGAPIPAQDLPRIFDAFQRAHKKKEGTGLGLAIAKKIVELHRGEIRAEVTPEQETVFRFSLPMTHEHSARVK